MARSGQSLSLISGFHMAWWGGVIAAACFVSLIMIFYSLPFIGPYIWPAAIFIGWVGGRIMHRKLGLSSRHGVMSYSNRVTRYVWIGVGVISSCVLLAEVSQLVDFAGRGYLMIFLLCGLGLIVSSAAGNEPLLMLSGLGWFGVGILSLFYTPSAPIVYGATAIACIVFMTFPGLVIALRKPS